MSGRSTSDVYTLVHVILVILAVRSKAWVCGRSLAGIVVSIATGAWMSIFCECCVLSGRGLCAGLITHPEESCQVWCVLTECDHESSTVRRSWPSRAVAPW